MLAYGYLDKLMLSIMADTGQMESIEEVKVFGSFIEEEMKKLEDALVVHEVKDEKKK